MKSNKILFLFSIIVIADVLTSLAFNFNLSFWNFGVLVKTPIELYLLTAYLKPGKNNIIAPIIIVLLICWLIGIIATLVQTGGIINVSHGNFLNNAGIPDPLLESFLVFNRYIFFFVLAGVLIQNIDDPKLIDGCRKIFEAFLLVNSVAILLGAIFKLSFLSSYDPKGDGIELRFGYKGLLYGINEVSGVYFLGVAYYYREIFLFKRKRLMMFLLVVLAAFLTGTKGSVLAFVLLSIYYFSRYKPVLFLLCFIPLVYYGYQAFNENGIENLKSLTNMHFDSSSIISFLLTGRDIFIEKNFEYMGVNWNALNYMFGDGILYSETDLMDLYYFFGLAAIYYIAKYIRVARTLDLTTDFKYIFILLLLFASTGGHVVRSAVFPVFFVLYLITSNYKPATHRLFES